jgi:hypothetical protein
MWAGGGESHPVDAEVEGSYAPGQTVFSRLQLADEECSFSTKAQLTAKSVELSELRLMHGAQTWLQGEATLPREVFRDWTRPIVPPAPVTGAPLKLRLKATGLSLKHAARLSGWSWPVEGFVDGELSGGGALGQLALQGQLGLVNGRIPIGWSGNALDAVRAELRAKGQVLSIADAAAEYRGANYSGNAQLDLTKYGDPILTADAGCDHALFPLYEPTPSLAFQPARAPFWCEAAIGLQIAGPLSSAAVKGTVHPTRIRLDGIPQIAALWARATPVPPVRTPFVVETAPFQRWPVQISVQTAQPVPVTPGNGYLLPALEIRGTAHAPQLIGSVKMENIPASGGALPLTIKLATLNFRADRPQDPMIDLHASGVVEHFPFNAYVLGPLSQHMSFADSEDALQKFAQPTGVAETGAAPLQVLEQPGLSRGTSALPWAPITLPGLPPKSASPAPAGAPPATKAE